MACAFSAAILPYGPQETFYGFQWDAVPRECIDYIFVSDPVRVLKYGTRTDSQDPRYPRDHFPVVADVRLQR